MTGNQNPFKRLPPRFRTRRYLGRFAVGVIVLALLTPAGVAAVTPPDRPTLEKGTIERPANGTTVISVQGFKLGNQSRAKKPARLVGVGPNGSVEWVRDGNDEGIAWFYDVDPLDNGTLLITGIRPGETIVEAWNPETGETLWTERFDIEDTHDVDLINGDQLLVANMRNYNGTTGRNNDRIFIYDRSENETVWEWRFRNHGYNRSGGGDYTDDWTHVNDVDKIGEGEYLVSPRNFDQSIVVNRTTSNVTMQLGSDGELDTLYEQHNPQYLRGGNGTPTMLVADSENDRVVEYARTNGTWNRTWTLGSLESLDWPRDADRLPNGNTLVTDTLNHRVIEVTPEGEIVWEFYAPWGTYEAERMQLGDEPGGPTIREQNATGSYNISGSAGLTPGTGDKQTFAQWVESTSAGTPLAGVGGWFAARWSHVTPWIRPVWLGSWAFAAATGAAVVLIGWMVTEVTLRRRAIATYLRRTVVRVRGT
jgi:hypothetical protein